MRENSWLQKELERAKELGLTVCVEGRVCLYDSPEELSHILEEPAYMLDYVSDDEGRITGICFDRVNEKDFVQTAYPEKTYKS